MVRLNSFTRSAESVAYKSVLPASLWFTGDEDGLRSHDSTPVPLDSITRYQVVVTTLMGAGELARRCKTVTMATGDESELKSRHGSGGSGGGSGQRGASGSRTLPASLLPRGYFRRILIDEAGSVVESEAVVPLAFFATEDTQVVFAGDPHQLGPVLYSNTHPSSHCQAGHGLSSTVIDRLHQTNCTKLYLRCNYR